MADVTEEKELDIQHASTKRSSSNRCCTWCSLIIRQFFLLLGKNFLLQIRRPIGTIIELLIPIFAILILVAFRYIPALRPQEKCFVTFDSDPLVLPDRGMYNVYYAPNNSEIVQNLSTIISPKLSNSQGNLIGVASQSDFIREIQNSSAQRDSGCFLGGVGIFFEDLDTDNVKYTIRLRQNVYPYGTWDTRMASSSFQTAGARVSPNPYLNEGFMQLEKIIDESIIELKTGKPVNIDVSVRQFPYPSYLNDPFLEFLNTFFLPLFIILSFIYSSGVFVKELVLEKESRIRETMKMMGLSNWTLWTTWFLKQTLFYLGSIIIITILLKYGGVFPRSDGFLIFVYLLMFMLSGIAFCFFISVWFSSARIGLFAGIISWFVAYFPYFFLSASYNTLNLGTKMGLCILSNTCVGLGVNVLSIMELRQEGLSFSNFARPLSLDDQFNMFLVVFMLAVDTVIYMILYWYIDAVKPGKYGVPKPFYFLFVPSYWCPRLSRRPLKPDELEALSDPSYNAAAHEDEPTDIPVGIVIRNLTKIYNRRSLKKRKLAVDHLSLKMYRGQVTALLGHNGAGKTTTLSILTGLFPPTDGNAYINGLSVVKDIDLIRNDLGICPQHNVLFDRLTVSEHLSFFARLKGCPFGQVSREVNLMVEDLMLTDKRKTQSQYLSGGMKRKLSVGIALVGGSKFVILDEPTSGMDPYARRATWDLLAKHKQERTILLTTHSMDEADILGDRIAIMSEGRLRCSGSSLFLKSRYGVGYHMTIAKEPQCDSHAVTSLVKHTVAGAEQDTDVGAELSFILPSQSIHQFSKLFDTLDGNKEELGISSFGVSVTTMEEVFIRVATGTDEVLLHESRLQRQISQQEEVHSPRQKVSPQPPAIETELTTEDVSNEVSQSVPLRLSQDVEVTTHGTFNFPEQSITVNTGIVLWFQQFFAMFLKRLYHSFRFWISIIWQLIIPLIFVLWGLIIAKTVPGLTSEDPKRLLSIQNSAPTNNITFFWAQLAESSGLDLGSSDDAQTLGVTNFFNYTGPITDLKNVTAHTDLNKCCDYQYQMLDKYCASRSMDQLPKGNDNSVCSINDTFGYRNCPDCLVCCSATSKQPDTCTNPALQNQAIQSVDCPYPPSISISDFANGSTPTGPLDDINVYVAEQILTVSSQFKIYDFLVRFQGGYVFHSAQPTYSVCGCQSSVSDNCRLLAYALDDCQIPYPYITETPVRDLYETCSDTNCSSSIYIPICDNLNSSFWYYDYDYWREICGKPSPCPACSSFQIGTTSQPYPSDDRLSATVWYNNQPYHMGAAALNGFYNLYLKSLNSNVTISVYNYPLPRSIQQQVTDTQNEFFGIIINVLSIFGLSFLFASFVVFIVQERDSKAKHLQFVSGVHATSYWLATFAWDLLNAFIPVVLTVVIFAAFQINGYKGQNIGALFLLLLFGCWAIIPVNYMMSFLFANALVAFVLMLCLFFFGALVMLLGVQVAVLANQKTSDTLNYIFMLHPVYAVLNGLNKMYTNQLTKETCEQSDVSRLVCSFSGTSYANNVFTFSSPGIGHVFLYLILEGILFLVIAIMIERQFFIPELKRLLNRHKKKEVEPVTLPEEDDDVAAEKRKVNSSTEYSESDAIVIKNLIKEYKDLTATVCICWPYCQEGCKLAVNGISLIIPSGECFGLLGVNGAGKTTTFKMLTGDLTPTYGTAVLSGYDIRTQLRQVQQRIGYCPQFDALIEKLTGKEILTMFARLRGIPEKAIKGAVQAEIDRLDLAKHANKRCGTYSGGNKRKLSTAIALVGNPPILLLDEPTTGMDPATRRFLWNVLTNIIKEGRSVILTSHSMEECEALCTRLAIMVNGTFKCLGSIQHLKSKFGSGYTLQIKVSPSSTVNENTFVYSGSQRGSHHGNPSSAPLSPKRRTFIPANVYDTSRVQQFITNTFPGSLILEQHQGTVTFRIPAEGVTWSRLFSTVEQNKEQLLINSYSVSQTTLDQVFINFAQEQEDTSV